MVSESAFSDDAVLALEPQLAGFAVWVALIVTADNSGRTEGDAMILRATTLAGLTDFTVDMVEEILVQMEDAELIERYTAQHRRHARLLNWRGHQQLKHTARTDRPVAPTEALEARIVREIKSDRFDWRAIAWSLWRREFTDERRIFQILRRLERAGAKVRNPWAYIRSQGLLDAALSDAVEEEAESYKETPPPATRGRAPESVGDVLARSMPGKPGAGDTPVPPAGRRKP